MEEISKPIVPSFLLGQLMATVQLLEEDIKSHDAPNDNSLTVAELFFNEMIEHPEKTLAVIEQRLAPRKDRIRNAENKKLVRDMTLIYKIKKMYQLSDEHLNEDEFFKGYYQQLKTYFDKD